MSHIGISVKEIDGNIQDIHLGADGGLAMVFDSEAIGQHAKQRTKTFKGEWFLNSDVGVPWLTEILGQGYNPALAEAVIKSVIQKTDGVTEIVTFSVVFDRSVRNLKTSNIEIKTIYNEEG